MLYSFSFCLLQLIFDTNMRAIREEAIACTCLNRNWIKEKKVIKECKRKTLLFSFPSLLSPGEEFLWCGWIVLDFLLLLDGARACNFLTRFPVQQLSQLNSHSSDHASVCMSLMFLISLLTLFLFSKSVFFLTHSTRIQYNQEFNPAEVVWIDDDDDDDNHVLGFIH